MIRNIGNYCIKKNLIDQNNQNHSHNHFNYKNTKVQSCICQQGSYTANLRLMKFITEID